MGGREAGLQGGSQAAGILAKGKRGLAEVTLARQDSVIRHSKYYRKGNDDSLETIFEFLEKTKRYEDRAWSSQRGRQAKRSLKD